MSTNHNSNDQAVLEPPGLFFKQIQTHTCFKILWFVKGIGVRVGIVFGYHVFSCICVDLPGLKTSGLPRAIGVRARFGFGCFCIFRYFCVLTRVENLRFAKGDWGEGEVAADEEQVGDAQGSQQVVEHTVHLSGEK